MISPEHLLISLFCLFVLTVSSATTGHNNAVTVVVQEGSDAILPCCPSTTDLVHKTFDWKKDGRKEVFFYDDGRYYGNGRSGQDEQFSERVSHFPNQLQIGNASIIIRATKTADSGEFSCLFPHLEPSRPKCHIQLVVQPTNKDRSGEISGAAPVPVVRILNTTQGGVLLRCEVRGAFPEPKVQWQDSDGNVLPAEEPEVRVREGRFYVTRHATVAKTTTNRFLCVANQEDISHKIDQYIDVPDKLFESCPGAGPYWIAIGCLVGLSLAAFLALSVAVKIIKKLRGKYKCAVQELNNIKNL